MKCHCAKRMKLTNDERVGDCRIRTYKCGCGRRAAKVRPVSRVYSFAGDETMGEWYFEGIREQHDGDCTIYSSLCNGRPEDGICTCGYGNCRYRSDGVWASSLYSDERLASFAMLTKAQVKRNEKEIVRIFSGKKNKKRIKRR